ncbi:Peptidyl-prolyl cis-trans isomerase [Planococcus halocryophilus Or1]|uniref:Peptidyl-prolyl cis-trans isomerase n=1 Tax=Planococcus halocryophilus TaxID=1215089 RepID=A0A1C7DMV8_9BACL|nr:peptidylprolyl isomerase [Planococcus halocryophilus]ANU12601.1 peptidylprolyl isomerase [Planococcus halocryophilus]EMF46645.1 Peptidyl-prolyl cis-trans isomerase [Planococcus halocryophilus Or1]
MKKTIIVPILVAFLLGACSAQQEETKTETTTENSPVQVEGYPQLSQEVAEDEALVEFNTSMGMMKIKLFPEIAPKAVENFLTHAKEGYYDGLTFHRVIENFMLQTGDPTGTGGGGESIYGAPFEDEFNDHLVNIRGALSMANAGPGTNGSQFFIVQAPEVTEDMFEKEYPQELRDAYLEQGGTPWLDGRHTVFGQVIEGLDVVDAIAEVETVSEKPVEDVTIESIKILQQ